jgi:hypothetical protein
MRESTTQSGLHGFIDWTAGKWQTTYYGGEDLPEITI